MSALGVPRGWVLGCIVGHLRIQKWQVNRQRSRKQITFIAVNKSFPKHFHCLSTRAKGNRNGRKGRHGDQIVRVFHGRKHNFFQEAWLFRK